MAHLKMAPFSDHLLMILSLGIHYVELQMPPVHHFYRSILSAGFAFSLPYAILGMLQSQSQIKGGLHQTSNQVLTLTNPNCEFEIDTWASSRKEFNSSRVMVYCITGKLLTCGLSKDRRALSSSSPSIGVLKFSVDDQARGQSYPAGMRETLASQYSEGDWKTTDLWAFQGQENVELIISFNWCPQVQCGRSGEGEIISGKYERDARFAIQ